jgi:tRNA-splicing ligase RtcB (3'-phosphate/5'-hydroxy nucleic acid ligase)
VLCLSGVGRGKTAGTPPDLAACVGVVMSQFDVLRRDGGRPVKCWTRGVEVADNAKEQLLNSASLPFVHKWVAAMPDVHWGMGATIGSVIPTKGAIVPAAVGVDLGCGMMACQTSLSASDLPDSLRGIRSSIEAAVPHGRTHNGGRRDKGAWGNLPDTVAKEWSVMVDDFESLCDRHPKLRKCNSAVHLGTLGSGNHFIELCLDEANRVWVMLHSGSRGLGNRIGSHFIALAKKDMKRWFINLPDANLAYIPEGSSHFKDYIDAVGFAQDFARKNREVMMRHVMEALAENDALPRFDAWVAGVNCHHNYVDK